MASVSSEVALESNPENIIITRNLEGLLGAITDIQFDQKQQDEILQQMEEVSTGRLLGGTEHFQRNYLESAITTTVLEEMKWNKETIALFQDKNTRQFLLNMMLYGKYIFYYQSSSHKDIQRENDYTRLFKQNLNELQKSIGPEKTEALLKTLATSHNFFRIIPLTYQSVIKHDLLLEEFRASELVGHDIAYQIAKHPTPAKKIIVKNHQGNRIETYSIREIQVKTNSGSRDPGLMGSVLMPDDPKEDPPTVYITWAGTHSKGTGKADLERAAGEESYRRGEDQILTQCLDAILEFRKKNNNKPIKLVVCGHSLGGALSQLNYHSIQRILALNIKDPKDPDGKLQKEVLTLDRRFQEELANTTKAQHQRNLGDIRLPDDIRVPSDVFCEMSLDVWNSAGTLQPVQDHSNRLCALLVKHSIPQLANFGMVGGDAVMMTGQGTILSFVPENGAKIKILKVEPNNERFWTASLAAVGCGPTGYVLGGAASIGCPWLGAAIVSSATFGIMFQNKLSAHTGHHFKKGIRPDQVYMIFTTHNPDGTLNLDPKTGCLKVQEELRNKSLTIDLGSAFISAVGPQAGLRNLTQIDNENKKFLEQLAAADEKDTKERAATENKSAHDQHVFALLVEEINKQTPGANDRVLKIAAERNLINKQDKNQKTLLHYAIEKRQYDLAEALFKLENFDPNIQDKDGNTPLLTFMHLINTPIFQYPTDYAFGIKLLKVPNIDLATKNQKGESVQSIYSTWWTKGAIAREFSTALEDSLRSLSSKPKA